MKLTHPWEPEYGRDSRVLILGTFPSPKSRETGHFYGHPQNVFWASLAASLGVREPAPEVKARKRFVHEHGIALWDVFERVVIEGASDASIRGAKPNVFREIIDASDICAVFTTGRTATDAFNGLCSSEAGMRGIYLPSTSPANRRTQATPEYAHRWSLVGKVLKGELVSGTTMKELDRRAIEEKGVPSLVLMERAAQAVVEALRAGVPALSAGNTPSTSKNLLCVCGAGNNGGDGFAVARLLSRAGIPAEALFVGDERKMTAETRQQALLARDCGVAIHDNDLSVIAGSGILVDALFGIGLMRALAGAYLEAVRALCKARAAGAYVLAVDIPSGISPDTGEALGAAVAADETVTFAYPKIGQTIGQGLACSGKLSVADIGVYQD